MDGELYLPKTWTSDRDRCRAAKIPDERGFATKGELARNIVRRCLATGLPATWVTADEAYGQDWHVRRLLEQLDVGYVVAVPRSQQIMSLAGIWRIDELIDEAPGDAWQRLSCGDGAKGPRIYDWAGAKLPANLIFDPDPPTHHRWVMARRSLSDPEEVAYYLAYAPAGVEIAELAQVADSRWAIEECFPAAKNETTAGVLARTGPSTSARMAVSSVTARASRLTFIDRLADAVSAVGMVHKADGVTLQFRVDAPCFFELVFQDDDAAGRLDGGALVDEFAGACCDAQLVAAIAAVAALRAERRNQPGLPDGPQKGGGRAEYLGRSPHGVGGVIVVVETAVRIVCCHLHLSGTHGGPLVPYGSRAQKELHHLPTLILRRPSVSARPAWMLSGARGSRLLDRRPPHYRCPAVPGPRLRPGDPDGASFLRSSL